MSGPVETEGGSAAVPVPDADAPARGDAGPEQAPQPPVDRRAALAQGAPGIPDNFVFWVLGAVLVLSLGGLVGEHLFSSADLNPTATTTTTTAPRTPSAAPAASAPTSERSVSAPLAAFMGLSLPQPRQAPAFSLSDQTGQTIAVPARPPRAVVVTFFNAPCNDICPVLAAEIEQADADLGTRAAQVEFVTVNTDPAALAQSAEAPAVSGTGLGALANWHMLTGPLATLDTIWKAYGVSISVDTKTSLEAHNDVMDFVSPDGRVVYRATPFADESANRRVQLAVGDGVALGRGHRDLRREALGTVSGPTLPPPDGFTSEPPAGPLADPPPSPPHARAAWWHRHRTLAIAAVVVVIVVITVLTDLPVSTSRASDISAERSVMSEVNGDLGPCALAIHQAVGIWTLQETHRLTPADRAPTPGLLGDDQTACSFASEGINDLGDVQVPGTTAGKHLADMVATTILWTTSDALRAIEDVQTLMNTPNDASALHNLAKEETQLDEDRGSAIAQEQAADSSLQTHLQPVDLPAVASATSSS